LAPRVQLKSRAEKADTGFVEMHRGYYGVKIPGCSMGKYRESHLYAVPKIPHRGPTKTSLMRHNALAFPQLAILSMQNLGKDSALALAYVCCR
jgi:hypothetical protein